MFRSVFTSGVGWGVACQSGAEEAAGGYTPWHCADFYNCSRVARKAQYCLRHPSETVRASIVLQAHCGRRMASACCAQAPKWPPFTNNKCIRPSVGVFDLQGCPGCCTWRLGTCRPCLGPACALLISPYELLCCHELFSPCTHLCCVACLCLWAALPVACMCPACAAWAACALLLLHWTAVRCAVAECSCAVLPCAELLLSVLSCS